MKLTPSQRRRAQGFALVGIGIPIAGPAATVFYMSVPRSHGPLFELPAHVSVVLWATIGVGAALALAGAYLIKSARQM